MSNEIDIKHEPFLPIMEPDVPSESDLVLQNYAEDEFSLPTGQVVFMFPPPPLFPELSENWDLPSNDSKPVCKGYISEANNMIVDGCNPVLQLTPPQDSTNWSARSECAQTANLLPEGQDGGNSPVLIKMDRQLLHEAMAADHGMNMTGGENILYEVVIPQYSDSNSGEGLGESSSLNNVALINGSGNPSFFIQFPSSVTMAASDGSSDSSGVSTGQSPSEFSDDTNFSQEFNDVSDEALSTSTVTVIEAEMMPSCVDHIETVGLEGQVANSCDDNEDPNTMSEPILVSERYYDENGCEVAKTEAQYLVFSTDEVHQAAGSNELEEMYQENAVEEVQNFNVVEEDPTWQQVREEFINDFYADGPYLHHPVDQDWTPNENSAPRKKRRYVRKNPAAKRGPYNTKKIKIPSTAPVRKPRGRPRKTPIEPLENVAKKRTKNKKKPVKKSGGNISKSKRNNSRFDVTSFRFKMGPHLRTLSSILELSEMRHVSEYIPSDAVRRFHPADMYRSMEKHLESNDNQVKGDSNNVDGGPYWNQMEVNAALANSTAGLNESIQNYGYPESRLYYRSLGTPKNESHRVISIRQELEENGILKASPDVLTAIGSAELNVIVNLHAVAEKCLNTELKVTGEHVGPLTMRLKDPMCTGLLYESGKLLVIGAKTYQQFRIATRKFARMVQKSGFSVRLTGLKMHFYVGFVILPFEVNVEAMIQHESVSKFICYDRDIFPGIILSMNDSPILCLIFKSGAVLMTGATKAGDMKKTLDEIYPTLRLFGSYPSF